jgi:hypothetical protein
MMSFVSLAFAQERKKKKNIISLSHHTIATMNAFFATFAFPPPLLTLPPLPPSNEILLRHHLRCHPLPPCSKEHPRMTTGTGGGGALSTAPVTCRHHHYISHSLSGATFGGALHGCSIIPTLLRLPDYCYCPSPIAPRQQQPGSRLSGLGLG